MRSGRPGRAQAWPVAVALAAALACGGGGGSDDGPFIVSGTIAAPSSTAVDSDVNDLLASFAPNDTPPQAQDIPTPVTLGGYVNVAGAETPLDPGQDPHPPGRSTPGGDAVDMFRASLVAGQVIRLFVAEDVPGTAQLDLRLLTVAGAQVATSTGSQIREIMVPSSDTFVIEVSVMAGYSNYVLTVGQPPTATGAALAAIPAQPRFVPGEIVVRYRDDLLGAAAARTPAQQAASIGMQHVAGRPGGPMLFSCRDEHDRHHAFRMLGIEHLWRGDDPTFAALDGEERLRQDTLRLAKAMARQPDVASAAPNYIREASDVPLDEFYPFQWHFESIGLPQAWDATDLDSGATIAVLDTGVVAHPDFTGRLRDGYDFVSNVLMAGDGNGCDANESDPGDLGAPGGSSWHGTHVAGIAGARTSFSAGNTEGVAGVAWNTDIMPLRVLGIGGGTDFDIMAAIRYAARLDNNCGVMPPTGAQIVNMSLGGPGFSQPFQDLVTQLSGPPSNMFFVAAAGNSASSSPSYPAAYNGVISVSATGPLNGRAPYSNFGASIDVAAPGGDLSRDVNGDGFGDGVLSTYFNEGTGSFNYAFLQGTSMAAPHVAGVIALMLAEDPTLTPQEFDTLLGAGMLTRDIGSSTFFGAGLIDAVMARNAAAATAGGGPVVVNPFLRLEPEALNFGILADAFLVEASNGGGGAGPSLVSVTPTTMDGAPWLSVTPESIDAGTGLGSYRVSVDRTGLANGLYVGTVSFDSDANDVDVAVFMQVGNVATADPNAGHHFVLLTQEQDDGSFETLHAAEVDPANGVYSFSFGDVEPGRYVLFAGSDADGDFLICDPGEACGAYPALDSIQLIDVQDNQIGLVFDTGFEVGIGTSSASAAAAGGVRRLPVAGGVRRSVSDR